MNEQQLFFQQVYLSTVFVNTLYEEVWFEKINSSSVYAKIVNYPYHNLLSVFKKMFGILQKRKIYSNNEKNVLNNS